jgi:AcrR family transcriptional regulator
MNDQKFEFNEESYFKILSKAIELEVTDGHLQWSLTKLSKESSFSRSLIYYYFGSNKLGILKDAIERLGADIVGLSEDRLELAYNEDFTSSFLSAKRHINKIRFFIPFYFLHRENENEIGSSIRKVERAFQDKLELFLPHMSQSQLRLLHGALMGILFSQSIDEKDIVTHYKTFITRLTQMGK